MTFTVSHSGTNNTDSENRRVGLMVSFWDAMRCPSAFEEEWIYSIQWTARRPNRVRKAEIRNLHVQLLQIYSQRRITGFSDGGEAIMKNSGWEGSSYVQPCLISVSFIQTLQSAFFYRIDFDVGFCMSYIQFFQLAWLLRHAIYTSLFTMRTFYGSGYIKMVL
jgi:hypothetical protein